MPSFFGKMCSDFPFLSAGEPWFPRRFRSAWGPRAEYTFCSAWSRIVHVLITCGHGWLKSGGWRGDLILRTGSMIGSIMINSHRATGDFSGTCPGVQKKRVGCRFELRGCFNIGMRGGGRHQEGGLVLGVGLLVAEGLWVKLLLRATPGWGCG